MTYACGNAGIPISLLWPTKVAEPKWTLRSGVDFGLGTTYGDAVFHAFEISKGKTHHMFLEKCQEVLDESLPTGIYPGRADSSASDSTGGSLAPLRPLFQEQWYTESELSLLEAAVRFARPLKGDIIELGCWEGRSTAAIANACYPDTVIAVDTWKGSVSESPNHETVRLARNRDVFAIFQANMHELTRGNVKPSRMDVMEFLRCRVSPIKFCHLDAAHDYRSVIESIKLLTPWLVRGGVLFGHDYEAAHAGRVDLQGGVQRAVRESFPNHAALGNNWWYVRMAAS